MFQYSLPIVVFRCLQLGLNYDIVSTERTSNSQLYQIIAINKLLYFHVPGLFVFSWWQTTCFCLWWSNGMNCYTNHLPFVAFFSSTVTLFVFLLLYISRTPCSLFYSLDNLLLWTSFFSLTSSISMIIAHFQNRKSIR